MIKVPLVLNVIILIITLSASTHCQEYNNHKLEYKNYDFKNGISDLDSNWTIENGYWNKSNDSCGPNKWSLSSGIVKCPSFANISIENIAGSSTSQVTFSWKKLGPSTKYEFYEDDKLIAECEGYGWNTISIPIRQGVKTIKWVLNFCRAVNGNCIAGSEGVGWICNVRVPMLTRNMQNGSFPYPPYILQYYFRSASYFPDSGSILCPFNLSVESSIAIGSTVELQIADSLSENWEYMGFISITDPKRIIFNNIKFDSGGKKKFRFLYMGLPSPEYRGPDVFPLNVIVDPDEGSNFNPYIFNISRSHLGCCDHPFDIYLEIQDRDGKWDGDVKGLWTPKNITFSIKSLEFMDPFIENIKYRFKIGNDEKYIGPFYGPRVYINYKNFRSPRTGIYDVDVKSERCPETIYFNNKKYHKQIYSTQIYMDCGKWQPIECCIPGIDPNNIGIGNNDE